MGREINDRRPIRTLTKPPRIRITPMLAGLA